MRLLKQSSTAQPLVFLMVQSSDHVTGLTGATVTVTMSKAGAAFGAAAGAVSEIANGWYKVAGNATDTGTLGALALHASATGGDPTDIYFDVVAFDPQDGVHFGITGIPNAAAGAVGGLPLAVDTSGRVDVLKINGTSQTARDIGASVLLSSGTGTGQISLSSGAVLLQATQTGVTIPAVTTVGSVTGAVGSVTGAVGSVTAAITLPTIPTDWISAAGVKADAVTKIQAGLSTYAGGDTSGTTTLLTRVTAAVALASGVNVTQIAGQTASAAAGVAFPASIGTSTYAGGAVASVTGAVGSVTGNVGGSVGSISGVTFPTHFSALGITSGGAISEVVLCDTITTYTGNTVQTADVSALIPERLLMTLGKVWALNETGDPVAPAATALTTSDIPQASDVATAVLTLDWTGVSGEASYSTLNGLRFLRNKWSVSGSTLTVFKEDGTTTAYTHTLTTDPSAVPITGVS